MKTTFINHRNIEKRDEKEYFKKQHWLLHLLIVGFNVYNSQKSDVMSELALANVEALAESELSQKCGDCSTDKQVYCCTLVIEGLGTFTLNKRLIPLNKGEI